MAVRSKTVIGGDVLSVHRRRQALGLVGGWLVFACVLAAPGSIAPAASAAAQTTVSLTFDGGDATPYAARTMLSSHGVHGTFFLNGPRISSDSYYMTWSQINDLYADGNEIGGHTAYHVNLTTTDPTEA